MDYLGLKRVPVYDIQKSVAIFWYAKYIFGDAHKTINNNFHTLETIKWTAEVPDNCTLKYIETDSFSGPNQWGWLQTLFYQVTHTEYVYENTGNSCDGDCQPSDYQVEIKDYEFPFPGTRDLGSYPFNRGPGSPRRRLTR